MFASHDAVSIRRSVLSTLLAWAATMGLAACAQTDTQTEGTDEAARAAVQPASSCAHLTAGEREECERQGHAQDPETLGSAERGDIDQNAEPTQQQQTSEAEANVDTAGAAPGQNSRIRQASGAEAASDSDDESEETPADATDRVESERDSDNEADTLGKP